MSVDFKIIFYIKADDYFFYYLKLLNFISNLN